MVLFMLVGGVIADRFPRQRVMMIGEVTNALAFFALAAMLFTGWTPLPALAIAAGVSGVAMAILFPALQGIIPEVVPADRLQAGNALLGLGANSSRIAGAVLGGATVVLLGGAWALAASGLLFTIAGICISMLRLPTALRVSVKEAEGMPGPERHSVIKDLREGWREFITRQWLWVVVAQFSVMLMAMQAAHGVLGPLVAKSELGGAAAWTAVLTGEAIGTIVGVAVSLRLRPKRPIFIATLLTIPTALPYLLLGLSAPLWSVVLGSFLLGICFDVFGVLWQTTMQREIPAEALSRVSSYDALGSLMFGPIGLMLAGPVAAAIGPKPALVGCAVIVTLVSLAAALAPGVRNLKAPEPAVSTR
jgi:predicted MFS family arabinose efflux permease